MISIDCPTQAHRIRGMAALCLILAGSGCQRDYRFETVAQYEAPRGGYRLSVHASGVVRAGDDLSERSSADVTIEPATVSGSTIHFTALVDPARTAGSLAGLIADAGYQPVIEEVSEAQRAIDGALGGPKSTLMDGQTKALRVRAVTFTR